MHFVNSTFLLYLCVVSLSQVEGRRQLLTTELWDLQEKKKQTEQEVKRNSSLQASIVSNTIHTDHKEEVKK